MTRATRANKYLLLLPKIFNILIIKEKSKSKNVDKHIFFNISIYLLGLLMTKGEPQFDIITTWNFGRQNASEAILDTKRL